MDGENGSETKPTPVDEDGFLYNCLFCCFSCCKIICCYRYTIVPVTNWLDNNDDLSRKQGLPLGWVQHGEGSGCTITHPASSMCEGGGSCETGWTGSKYQYRNPAFLDEDGNMQNGEVVYTDKKPEFAGADELYMLCNQRTVMISRTERDETDVNAKATMLILSGMKVNKEYLRYKGEITGETALMACAIYSGGHAINIDHIATAKKIIACEGCVSQAALTDQIRMQSGFPDAKGEFRNARTGGGGKTALHMACSTGWGSQSWRTIEMIKILIEADPTEAHLHMKDENGRTALDYCKLDKHYNVTANSDGTGKSCIYQCADVLRAAGATE